MKDERGMTMVELVAAVAVTGIIVVFLGTAVFQIITVSASGNDQLIALHELQNAARWFNDDGRQAVDASAGAGLTFTISDNATVNYSLVGTELRRTAGGSMMTLARNISDVSFSSGAGAATMSLTATPAGRYGVSESAEYQVTFRAEGGGS
jgi:prepilin-type N-terminal cleavage/methylation domain-containing protein